MGNENTGAKQAQKRRNRLDHRKYPLRPYREQNDMPGRTVKRIPDWKRRSGATDDLAQQLPASGGGRRSVSPRFAIATNHSPHHRSPHFRRLPAAVCSYVAAEVGCIGDIVQPGPDVGMRPVEW
jgi:hypothetical protein